jgi:hypothetical protein
VPQRGDITDIGLGSTGPDGEADRRARDVRCARGCDRAGLDQLVELRARKDCYIEQGAILDRFFSGPRVRRNSMSIVTAFDRSNSAIACPIKGRIAPPQKILMGLAARIKAENHCQTSDDPGQQYNVPRCAASGKSKKGRQAAALRCSFVVSAIRPPAMPPARQPLRL